ncbi:MAG: hypothetical protein JST21_02195 [Bacteroidetes bacterium]|nr:hypothetical protein [Bacteroidota bacterium]
MNKIVFYIFFACCITFFFSCTKELSEEHTETLQAEGSLWDSTGSCLPYSIYGTVYGGITPGQDTAYVEIQVNVSSTGSYKIESDLQDGYQYYDSGFFSNTGLNIVHLKPIGTPIIPGTFTFNISYDSTYCSFTVNVQDSTGTGLGGHDSTVTSGNWQFTTDDGTFSGSVDTAFIESDSAIWGTGGKMLTLQGLKTPSNDTVLELHFYLPTGSIQTGAYNTTDLPPSNSGFFALVHYDLSTGIGTPVYQALPNDTAATIITLTINTYDPITHIISGTFLGTAGDANDDPNVNVINGSYTATVTE